MLKRVRVFGNNNVATWPSGPKQWHEDLAAKTTGVIDRLDAQAESQAGASGDFHGGATSKGVLRNALLLELRGINRTAGAIAEASNDPGVMDQFRMPHGVSDQVLVARATAMAAAAEAKASLFIDYGHAPSFAADLRNHINAFENADDSKEGSLEAQAGATAGLSPLLKEGLMKVKQLDAFVHNFYQTDATKMGEWRTASHIERQAKKKTPPTP